jgi:hypothetical protein
MPEMTPEERVQWYRDRDQALQAKIESLPGACKEFLYNWRRCVELCGRVAPGGDSADHVMRFVDDLQGLAYALTPVPEKVAGYHSQGNGV